MGELTPLPAGQVIEGVRVYNNRGGGLMETTVEFMAVCEEDDLDLRRRVLANLVATYNALNIEIKPGELEAIRTHYGI